MPRFKCDICGKEVEGYWNNPAPLEGKHCCDNCNKTYVIPARMKQINIKNKLGNSSSVEETSAQEFESASVNEPVADCDVKDDAAGSVAGAVESIAGAIGNAMGDGASCNCEDGNKIYAPIVDADYSKVTKQGFKIIAMFRDGGRLHVIAKRSSDYVVGFGYDTTNGTWAQGSYDWTTYENALQGLMEEKPHSKKIQDTAAEVNKAKDAAPVFKITYKRDGIYSAVMMRGSNENEVRNKFKNLTGYEIAGVVPCKESDIAEFGKRGMAVIDCAIEDCGMGKAYVEEYDSAVPVEDARRINYDDDIIKVTLNGKEVFKGYAEDWIDDDFYEKFKWTGSQYENTNTRGKWIVKVVDKSSISDEGTVETGEISVGNKYRWEERYEGLTLTVTEVTDEKVKLSIDSANKAVIIPIEKFNNFLSDGTIDKVDTAALNDSKINDAINLKQLANLINQAVDKAESAGKLTPGVFAEDYDDYIKVGVASSRQVRQVESIVKSIINANSEARAKLDISSSSHEVFIELK